MTGFQYVCFFWKQKSYVVFLFQNWLLEDKTHSDIIVWEEEEEEEERNNYKNDQKKKKSEQA